ncbi:flagellar biosynthetic protein FliR [Sandaracinobacteroides saxicola]|uniref:Flagellar biosynthetic protein FliR n=1 Tax=Sandaracinobacteroides saxicola TaxID=2759707 RepID=A0A7G5IK03_9SPHN|nr:flagellar biosynthetic protein FliR [Sandaracinobacteroides saxicola]QMW23695.1 flagellar biosynthetic protein FliR [Sandaracinobacteroides saxicola]
MALLSQLGLEGQAALFALTFSRIAGFLTLMPAVGEEAVPMRVRMMIAIGLTLAALPHAVPVVQSYQYLALGVVMESAVGAGLGLLVRLVYTAAVIAGSYIASSIGIAGAIFFDPAAGGDTTAVTRIIVLAGLLMILVLDLHHVLISGLVASYRLNLGQLTMDLPIAAAAMLGKSFEIALRMSAPFLAYGLLFNLALGLLSRLTPQLQIFFIAQPANLLLGLALLLMCLGVSLSFFARALGDAAGGLFG